MDCVPPEEFKHTTLKQYPTERGAFIGVTVLDETPDCAAVYLRTQDGLLWPARTINHDPPEYHRQIVAAWMQHEGDNRDERTVKP